MSSRLRTLDSKISFFAFADIITAVSGVLIFVALLLATDLGRPSGQAASAQAETERQLQEIQARQAEMDAKNQRLEELLATAENAPDAAKLQADISRLQSDLQAEKQKQSTLLEQMSASQAALRARDQALGLTELKASIVRLKDESAQILKQVTTAHQTGDALEKEIAHADAQLVQLRRREGQIWLIPEKSLTTKEPILVTVAGSGLTIERFNHPEQGRQFPQAGSAIGLKTYLYDAQSTNQYVVFLVRPSGIALFEKLVMSVRQAGFDVGYDALEENRQVHFSVPPPIEEGPPPPATFTEMNHGDASGGGGSAGGMSETAVSRQGTPSGSNTTAVAMVTPRTNSPPAHPVTTTAATPKPKSWWQRFLEWLGFK